MTKVNIDQLPVAVIERWANTLESGEYPQTTGHLRTVDGFCCLGVLSDLYIKDKGKQWEREESVNDAGEEYLGDHFACHGEYEMLPSRVWEFFADGDQVDDLLPVVSLISSVGEPFDIELAVLNDSGLPEHQEINGLPKSRPFSFTEIAAVLRQSLVTRADRLNQLQEDHE